MLKAWWERPLPKWFDPLEKGARSFFIIASIACSIYALFTIEEWKIDLDSRIKSPGLALTLGRPVTPKDYLWIAGTGALLLLVLLALAFCRYILKRGHVLAVAVGASVLFWALDTVHPLVQTYTNGPFIKEGTEGFFIPLHILSHLMPGVFFGCSLVLWATLALYCTEWLLRHLAGAFRPGGSY